MTLDEFVQELAARRGLHRKVGLVARYWRQVQSLPADKQQQVALALGSRAAWSRLEKLFAKDGTLSDGELAVKRALDRVGGADPDEMRDLAAQVRSGNYAGVSRELLEVVGQALDEEADSDELGRADGGTAISGEAEPLDPVVSIDEVAAGSEAASPAAAPDQVSAPAADPTANEPPVVEALFATASSPPMPEVAAEAAPPLPDVAAEPVSPLPEVVAEPAPPLPETVAAPTPPPPEAVTVATPPRREVVAEPHTARAPVLSATEKLGLLRTLRADRGYGARLGRSGRAHLLSCLGPGWAARRALGELIRAQAVDDLDEALWLTGHLRSDVQKAWCLGDLVQHWALDETELEQVLRAAPGPAATNRLRRRHARQGSSRRA